MCACSCFSLYTKNNNHKHLSLKSINVLQFNASYIVHHTKENAK